MNFLCVLLNENDVFVDARCLLCKGILLPKEVEARDVKKFLSRLKELEYDFVNVEVDVLKVYHDIISCSPYSPHV